MAITMQQARKDCSWLGDIVQVHTVGPYDIVEILKTDNDAPCEGAYIRSYSTYVNGKRTSLGYNTLDSALAGCIAYRALGPNCSASHYFIRGIGLSEEVEKV